MKISTYNNASPVTLSDKFIGTEVAGTPVNVTKNFLISDLLTLFQSNITLQNVLDAGNIATQSMTLTGDITHTGGYLYGGGQFTMSATGSMVLGGAVTFNSSVGLLGTVKDYNDTLGTSGQVLVSDGSSQVTWGQSVAGKVSLPVRFVEAVSKGDPVYVSGYNVGGSLIEAARSEADDSGTMPSIGLADADYLINTNGTCVTIGNLDSIDLSTLSPAVNVGDVLYVNNGGGLTKSAPIGTSLIQNVGIVSRNSGVNGVIEVSATGRANAFPNIQAGRMIYGQSTGQATETSLFRYSEENITQGTPSTVFIGETRINTPLLKATAILTAADNTAALAVGLVTGDVYQTATGELRIVI